MNQPSPCPQCRSERVWARAALGDYGITHVAFCPGCARAATLCGRCGGELVLLRQSSWSGNGRPRVETMLQCPVCRQTTGLPVPTVGPARVATPTAPARPGATASPIAAGPAVERQAMRRFAVDAPTPVVAQKVADDLEMTNAIRFVRQRRMRSMVEDAARRADAMARLEVELSRIAARGTH